MNFSEALTELKTGTKMRRSGWNGKGMWVGYERASDWSGARMRSFLYMFTAQQDYVPWVASQTDILADDWEVAA